MSRLSWMQRIYWSFFAKPAEDRTLFRQLIQHPIDSILEIGIGDGQRMRRIARLWRTVGNETLRFIGTDEFEAAQDGKRHLRLKQAHQNASQLGLKATLIPGDVESAIPRVAHKIGTVDLIIANQHLDPERPAEGIVGGWLQHLTHNQTIVLACTQSNPQLQPVTWQSPQRDARTAA